MSDTSTTILWVVVAVVVIALIVWFFVSASRRKDLEARRAEADRLRASLDARLTEVQQAQDRASVTGAMAAEAQAEADARAREARRLEEQAAAAAAAAERAQAQHDALAREADRIDPDVATEDEGDDEGGSLRTSSGAAVGSAAFTEEEDEDDDLADAENPFAPAADRIGAQTGSDDDAMVDPDGGRGWTTPPDATTEDVERAAASEGEGMGTEQVPSWRDDAEPQSRSESAAARATDEDVSGSSSGAEGVASDGAGQPGATADRNGADDMSDTTQQPAASADDADQARTTSTGRTDDASGDPTAGAEEGAAALSGGAASATAAASGEPVATGDEESEPRRTPTEAAEAAEDATAAPATGTAGSTARAAGGSWQPPDADEADEVHVPALEDREEHLTEGGTPSDDPGDHRGQPWATTTGQRPLDAEDPAQPDASDAALGERDDPTKAPEGEESAAEAAPASADEAAEAAADSSDSGSSEASAGAAEDASGRSSGRRVSEYEEVVDGGYGMGSAAPIGDGAQPLGHAVKGVRDGNQFLSPGDEGYEDAEPDVWFYDEDAARRSGFTRRGE